MRKFCIWFITLLFLFSCWSSSDWVVTDWLTEVIKKDFSINVPNNWEVIENTDNILPKPNNWQIELAVTSSVLKAWFKNNLLILSDELNTFTTSADFAILNNVWASKDYMQYTLLNSKDFIFTDEEQSILYTFEAKYNYDSPTLKFLQTSHICNQDKAFFFTIAIPTSVTDVSKYEDLLKSFKCIN